MKSILITTSWDDGHKLDVRLAALLKKYDISGTFYIAHKDQEWEQKDLLTEKEISEINESFEIGAHTMTHARLPKITDEQAQAEITESKRYLEGVIKREVRAFCYPRGEYHSRHVDMVREAGYSYARTVKRHSTTTDDSPLEAETTVNTYNHYSDLLKIARFAHFSPFKTLHYFQWDNLAKAAFDRVYDNGGVYHLWGHSWEIEKHGDWEKLESVLAYIAHRKNAKYVTNSELVALKPKRLLITTPYFPPHLGGTQLYVLNIAKRLQRDFGWEICIATSGERGGPVLREDYEGLTVYRLPYWFKISNTPVNGRWPGMLKRIIRDEDISLINAHAPVPFMSDIAAMVAGKKPFILTYHSGTLHKNRILPDILIWLYENGPFQLLLNRADFIVCSSDFVRFEFLQRYLFKSSTITPAVDVERFKPGDRDTEYPTILFVAGLTRSEQYKGLSTLINAFTILHKTIPRLRLVVVGDGNMKIEYEAQVRKLDLQDRIIFKGKLVDDELVRAYQEADIFVLPSLAPAESFGMVLIEAMATGKPVVGSKSGGIPRVIDHEKDGLLVTSGDVQGFASAIKRLIDDPALAKRFGEKGREKACAQYNWNIQAASYDNLLREIPEKKRSVIQLTGYYPPHMGGMEIVAEEISLELARRGYPVTVISSDIGAKEVNEYSQLYKIKRLKSVEIAHTPIIWTLPFRLIGLPEHSILHVHISHIGIPEIAMIVAKLRGFQLVTHFHLDVGPSGPMGALLPFYKRYFLGPVLRSADKVIVFSEEQALLVRDLYDVKELSIAVIPNGVSERFFSTQKQIDSGKRLRILYVGRLSPQKRVDRLIEGMAYLKVSADLTIVGDGEDREKLEAMVRELKLTNVSFEGRKDGNELLEFYRSADIFAILSDREGMPLVVLEAMASGLPIIASDVIGLKELVDGVGVLVGERFPEKFAEEIARLASDPKRFMELSEQSIEKSRQYSWNKLVERLETVYREMAP